MAMTELPTVLSSVVVVQQDESDYFLINLDKGDSVAVDRAEARIFESCKKGKGTSLEAAAHALAAELSAKEEDVLARVRLAIAHFQELGLCAT